MLLPAALAALAVSAGASAPDADAALLGGERWPGRTITYYTAPQLADVTATAAWAWRLSGVGVRFVRVSSRSRADFVVRRYAGSRGCHGLSTLGRTRGAFVLLASATCINTATHEFGHQLGLLHSDRRCALMYNGSGPNRGPVCDRDLLMDPNQICRAIKDDDIAGAVRRYGRAHRPMRDCAPWPAPQVADLAVSVRPDGAVELSGRMTRPATTTPWARVMYRLRSGFNPMVDITAAYDSCPAPGRSGTGGPFTAIFVGYGERFRWPVPAGAGSSICFTIVMRDAIGHTTTTQHTFPVTWAPPATEPEGDPLG
ncbi:MAG: matrixin family metalloprotease [Thermoleophilia bacterium]